MAGMLMVGFMAVGEDVATGAATAEASGLILGTVGQCLEHVFPGFVPESLLYGASALHA